MCYSIAFIEKKAGKLAARYQGIIPPGWKEELAGEDTRDDVLPSYYFVSGFAHPELPVFGHEGMMPASWGLIPHWAKDRELADKLRNGTLNAVGETVFEKPSFRKSIRSQRCLLAVDGFFEWREYEGKKYPYFIYPDGDELFTLGCLYDLWTDKATGEMVQTFSIITTPANPLLAIIHNQKKRMPLILPRDAEAAWVDPDTPHEMVKEMIQPAGEQGIRAHPVSRKLNYARQDRNTPEAIERVSYNELPDL